MDFLVPQDSLEKMEQLDSPDCKEFLEMPAIPDPMDFLALTVKEAMMEPPEKSDCLVKTVTPVSEEKMEFLDIPVFLEIVDFLVPLVFVVMTDILEPLVFLVNLDILELKA